MKPAHPVCPEPEWSYCIESDQISARAAHYRICAESTQREDLARRLGVVSVVRAEADFTVKRQKDKIVIYVQGSLSADVVQRCVLTCEPVVSCVTDSFEAWYADSDQAVLLSRARHARARRTPESETPICEESEDPDPIRDGKIDLGELATQYLALALPLYPQKEGAVPPAPESLANHTIDESIKNPFAALKDWKRERGDA